MNIFILPVYGFTDDFCLSNVVTKITSITYDIYVQQDGFLDGMSSTLGKIVPNLDSKTLYKLLEVCNIFHIVPEIFDGIDISENESKYSY